MVEGSVASLIQDSILQCSSLMMMMNTSVVSILARTKKIKKWEMGRPEPIMPVLLTFYLCGPAVICATCCRLANFNSAVTIALSFELAAHVTVPCL